MELTQPAAEATATLESLVDSRLVDSPMPGRYRVQGLLRHYATELHDSLPCARSTVAPIGRHRRPTPRAAAA